MTRDEYAKEWTYRVQERLGITCGIRKPSDSEVAQIRREVAEDMDKLEQLSANRRVPDPAVPVGRETENS